MPCKSSIADLLTVMGAALVGISVLSVNQPSDMVVVTKHVNAAGARSAQGSCASHPRGEISPGLPPGLTKRRLSGQQQRQSERRSIGTHGRAIIVTGATEDQVRAENRITTAVLAKRVPRYTCARLLEYSRTIAIVHVYHGTYTCKNKRQTEKHKLCTTAPLI